MSNLLKDASILLTPTAYENGRMNAIKPYKDLYGPELITNGDFAVDDNWSKGTGWTISGGKANGNNTTGDLYQENVVESGKKYKVTYTISNYVSGSIRVEFPNNSYSGTLRSANGTYTETILSGGTLVLFDARTSFTGSIDNVSVKEDLSGDFTFSRNSAATRVNAQGLVENVQIISDELVSNGNFSQIGTEEVSNGNFSQEGSELITNGDFATDSNWNGTNTNGVTISNGSLNYSETTLNHNVSQSNVVTIGKSYKVTLTISNYVKGSVLIIVGAGGSIQEVSSNGTFTMYGVASINNTFYLQARGVNGTSLSIDNISVKEVGQDWSLGTDWSIGDDKAVRVGTSAGNLTQSPFTVGKTYKVSWEQSNGFIAVYGNTLSTLLSNTGDEGVRIVYFTPTSSSRLDFRSTDDDAEVTNISVKEVGQDWTFGTGWSVDQANSKATFDGGADSNLTSSLTVVNGTKYRYKFDVSDMTAGGLSLRLGAGNVSDLSVTSNGTYEGVTTSEGTQLLFRSNSSFDGSISNISVKEITDDTDLPRINYEGFSYQDSLGSELITNGGFDTDSDWTIENTWTIGDGVANGNGANGSGEELISNSSSLPIGTYKIVFEIKNYISGSVIPYLSGATQTFSGNGVYTVYKTTTVTSGLKFRGSNFNGSIDNISVKEYLGQEVVPDSGCGSWLMEGQSTNLITYSEDFSQWNKQNSGTGSQPIITSNNTISPDGNQNADKIVFNKGAGVSASDLSVISSDSFTAQSNIASFYIKADSPQKIVFRSSTNWQLVDVTTEWQRISKTDSGNSVQIGLRDGYGISGIPDTATIYLWGVQAEAGSYSTSYVPTSGATSTRLADVANNSGNSTLINSTEGVLYAEIAALANDGNFRMISISDGSNNNRVRINYTATNQQIQSRVVVGGVTQAEINEFGFSNITDFTKIALLYKENEVKLYINGTLIGTDTSASMPSANTFDTLNFNGSISNPFYGKNKALAVYKEALTDANLRCLTYPNPVATTFDLDFDTIAEQFTFTRGSEATFVNEQGLIESTNQIGPELVTNGDFATDSDWNKGSGWSISGGKANANTVGSFVNLRTNSSVVEPSKIYDVSFDVSNYTQGSVRLSFIQSVATSQVSANGTYTARLVASSAGSSQVYIQGINSFIGSIDNVSVKEVTTATNTPRIDYSTGEKAFLLEPQSTNLITYSEDFGSGSGWVKFASGISFDANTTETLSPQGLYNATKIISSVNNEQQAIYKSYSIATPTISCYAKAAEFDTFNLKTSGGVSCNFTLTGDGEIGYNTNTSAKSIEYLGNGWYRCSISSSTNSTYAWISIDGGSIQGDGTSGIYIWGAQLEQLSYPTSYIPTAGATATRNQELCNNATPVINSEEGTLYAEISALEDDLTFRGLSISDGTTSNACRIYYRNSSNRVQFLFNVGGASQFQQLIDLTNIKDYNKIAFSYKKNNFKVYINGVKVAEDTNGIVPSANTFNKLSFSRADGGESFFGNTKGLKVYPKALADVQLEDLTTI